MFVVTTILQFVIIPRALNTKTLFVELLASDVEYIDSTSCDAIIIVAGDFNQTLPSHSKSMV